MGKARNTYGAVQKCIGYRVLMGKLEGNRPLGRPRRRWEDNNRMDLREVGYDSSEWIDLAEEQWRAYVRAVMHFLVP